MTARQAAPFIALAAWLAVIMTGLALAALQATEPPAWDSLSYLQKAFTFWQAVDAGKPFNPFALPMTIRPPGTVLLSYPLGWSDDYRWFYFRSSAIPAVLLAAATHIAGWRRDASARERWLLAALAAAAAGIPMLYQFQYTSNDWPSTWGLVDGFMAGVAALAAAAVVRSAATRSITWAIVAAVTAALCLLIKPTGALVMALTGIAWAIITLSQGAWKDQRFFVISLAAAVMIFAVTALAALTSAYFSAENIAFGQRALALFEGDSPTGTHSDAARLLHDTFGYVVPLIIAGGLLSALAIRAGRAAAMAALLCLVTGGWYWLFKTELAQVRYVLPFGMMAFVLVIPTVLDSTRHLSPARIYIFAVVTAAPSLVIAALLLMSAPPATLQRVMGVNLTTNAFGAENAQAADLLRALDAEGVKQTYLYVTDTTPPLRNVLAVAGYPLVTDPTKPQVRVLQPVDWQSPSATRTESLLRSTFIAFTPVKDDVTRTAILAHTDIPNFQAETLLMNAWLTGLGEPEGMAPVSETRVRIVRIVDHARFDAALTQLEHAHTWPPGYYAANPQRWWSAEKLSARYLAIRDAAFHKADDATTVLHLRGAETETLADGSLQVRFWVDGTTAMGDGWRIFAHLLNGAGDTLANTEVPLIPGASPTPGEPIRLYTVTYAAPPKDATAVAFGFLRAANGATEVLTTQSQPSDWDGHRLILPLPASR